MTCVEIVLMSHKDSQIFTQKLFVSTTDYESEINENVWVTQKWQDIPILLSKWLDSKPDWDASDAKWLIVGKLKPLDPHNLSLPKLSELNLTIFICKIL